MSRLASSCMLLMWVRTLSQTGQIQFTKNHVWLKLCSGAACRDNGSWLPVLAIWLKHQVTLWTLDHVGSSSQGTRKDSHSCPCPNWRRVRRVISRVLGALSRPPATPRRRHVRPFGPGRDP